MNIFINGQVFSIEQTSETQPVTLTAALSLYLNEQQRQSTFAIALNGDFVSKSEYERSLLNPDDCVDILFPIQGG